MFLVSKNACRLAAEKETDSHMSRPPLRPEKRRDDRLPNLRVTTAERAKVEAKAEAAELSLVEYCRRAIFRSRIAPRRSSVDQALLVELNSIGVNLNQIAKRVNSGRQLSPEFPIVLAELKALIRKINDGS